MIDKNYCASSYLTFRFIQDESINFYQGLRHSVFKPSNKCSLVKCKTADDVGNNIENIINREFIPEETAVFLSGGIDSAILASYVPEGTVAYTFKCIADGAVDETSQAKKYCELYGLKHKVIEMYWKDFEELTPDIITDAGVPVHSIEIQLYKAALQAKTEGIKKLIIGESADLIFGGMDKLLSRDWSFDEWVKRYTFVDPEKVLKHPVSMLDIYNRYKIDNNINLLKFMNEIFSIESSTSYMHAFKMAGIDYIDPYSNLIMEEPLNLVRVRNGEPKYLVRELFARRYPHLAIPNKIPMPRAMDQWLASWGGVKRKEFLDNCIEGLTGDQRWQLYCLELFFNIFEQENL